MNLLTKVKDIDTAIAGIHSAGQSLQTQMHMVACSVIQHYAKHNDKRVVLKLLQAMPEMARGNALREWMNAFGTFTVGDKDEIIAAPGKKLKLADAIAKPFYKFKAKEGAPYEPLEMDKWIERQIKALRKDQAETKRDHSVLIAHLQRSAIADPLSVN